MAVTVEAGVGAGVLGWQRRGSQPLRLPAAATMTSGWLAAV